ncbi:MAG: hypothetical protein JOZ53_07730 [Planctomycetaceae bacterium]|nr:hypothetical protein [Planctomycetaceae bacterium]
MSTATQQVVSTAWNFAHVLRDDGVSYMADVEQITFLLFLKMADEQAMPPYNRKAIVPAGYDRPSLLDETGDDLVDHYRHILDHLSNQPGMLHSIFQRARADIQKLVTLRRLISFCNWCLAVGRLSTNPFEGVPKANEAADAAGR